MFVYGCIKLWCRSYRVKRNLTNLLRQHLQRGTISQEMYDDYMSRLRTDIFLNPTELVSSLNKGLSLEQINKLPLVRYTRKEEENCAICMDEFKYDNELRELPQCKHLFHVGCIDMWLVRNDTCPLCKKCVKDWFVSQDADNTIPPRR